MQPINYIEDGTDKIEVLKGTLNTNRTQLLKKDDLVSFSAYLDFSAEEEIKQHENILKIPREFCSNKEFVSVGVDIIDNSNNRSSGRILVYNGQVALQHKVSNNLLKNIAFTITYLIG